ncbi:hypothetical protein O3M35_011527 [Rhynocoris fuscipes]|uniref:Ubiquitin carboxyl-terminal hydrolase n=1 Tax=Rhynocoris fuscipes TaxID=488301 RepID=A0AAW1CVG1_9HEMI
MPAQSGDNRVSAALAFSLIPRFGKKMGEISSPSSSSTSGATATESRILPTVTEVLSANIKYTNSDECYSPIGLYTKLKNKYTLLTANNQDTGNNIPSSCSTNSNNNNNNSTPVSSPKITPSPATSEKKNQQQIVQSSTPQKVINKSVNTASLPLPKKVLYPPNLICLGWKGSVPVGAGFVNLGNTCYLNSALQALLHVPAFVNWLQSDTKHSSQCEAMNGLTHSECLICVMTKILHNTHKFTGSAIKPLNIYSKLKDICKHLVHGQQEDAHEFLRYLIEGMERSYLTIFNGMRLDSYSKETTPLNQIFGGYMRTEVTCLDCGYVSTTFQHFQDLLLDIRQANSVEEALESYFSRERLGDGDQAYKCSQCKRKANATKKFSIERPPKALCIQLKRFNAMGGKNNKHISVKQTLDMTKYIHPSHPPGCPLKYKLVSMVSHLGQSANCGHYTAIGQSAAGSYYHFDDSVVRPVPLQNVLNTNAYIIMYELVETSRDKSFDHISLETNGIKVKSNESQLPQPQSAQEKKIKNEEEKQSTPTSSKQPHSLLDNKVTFENCNSSVTPKKVQKNGVNSKDTPNVECSLVPYLSESSESESGCDVNHTSSPRSTNISSSNHSKGKNVIRGKLDDKEKKENSIDSIVQKDKLSGKGENKIGIESSPNKTALKSEETTSAGKWSVIRTGDRDSWIRDNNNKDIKQSTSPGSKDSEISRNVSSNGFSSPSSSPRTTMQSLLEMSHQGYGTSNVSSWNGDKSKLSKDIENRNQNKRPFTSYDDCDRGKVKKKRYKNIDNDVNNSWNAGQDCFNNRKNWSTPFNGNSRQNFYKNYTYRKSKGHHNNHSNYREMSGNSPWGRGPAGGNSFSLMHSPHLFKKPHCT